MSGQSPSCNQGMPFCSSCTFADTETCDFCDEGDQYEECDLEDMDALDNYEPKVHYRKFRLKLETA